MANRLYGAAFADLKKVLPGKGILVVKGEGEKNILTIRRLQDMFTVGVFSVQIMVNL